MSNTQNNKELVRVGHEFAKAMSADTPIIEIAKMMSRLAERLDCTTAALRGTQAQRDQLAAENAALREWASDRAFCDDTQEQLNYTALKIDWRRRSLAAIKTPATDDFLAERDADKKRIAELEESHAQVIHSRDHYKLIADEGIRSLAEASTLTVKLKGHAVREGHPINEGKRGAIFPKDGGPWFSRFDVEHALHVAGIQLKVEE